jgi:hypothetical protein
MSGENGVVMTEKLTVGEGWVLLSVGGQFVFGRIVDEEEEDESDSLSLLPCYALIIRPMDQKGTLAWQCVPYGDVLLTSSRVPVVFDRWESSVDLGALVEADRQKFVAFAKAAEEMKIRMRAAASGLSLVPEIRGK